MSTLINMEAASVNLNLMDINKYCIVDDKIFLVRQLSVWQLIPNEGEYLCRKCGGKLKLTADSKGLVLQTFIVQFVLT